MAQYDVIPASRDMILGAIARELDTRDKRYMFLRINFPKFLPAINLEGAPRDVAWNIYSEFEKQQMIGSLSACMNGQLDTGIILELEK